MKICLFESCCFLCPLDKGMGILLLTYCCTIFFSGIFVYDILAHKRYNDSNMMFLIWLIFTNVFPRFLAFSWQNWKNKDVFVEIKSRWCLTYTYLITMITFLLTIIGKIVYLLWYNIENQIFFFLTVLMICGSCEIYIMLQVYSYTNEGVLREELISKEWAERSKYDRQSMYASTVEPSLDRSSQMEIH